MRDSIREHLYLAPMSPQQFARKVREIEDKDSDGRYRRGEASQILFELSLGLLYDLGYDEGVRIMAGR